ncbi:hypothetical protein K443DRAFT_95160 [Laccaria amethystina LaAM-08-1]|uniref:Unplaced genomic scaffold K443scaffold_45, whole genome shotgun sequence n=1 Tax=Laccaria amethystina LaAM-08-1 TaxID=1095629 RepID=A0A0C9XPG7_9AGAR|nr:hypothetical protein K443DRAFT_95160 [Laccaria amethystina LaAM-08-1]
MHVSQLLSCRSLSNFTSVFWFLYQYEDWRLNDGVFRINDFFNLVVETFESMGTEEWVSETLGWWDQ